MQCATEKPTFNFNTQLAKGQEAERQLDLHFAQQFDIHPVSREQQGNGLDRCLVDRQTGRAWLVEYKADWAASKTGNAFVETVSVDKGNKPGWAYSSMADYIMYYLPNDLLVYVFTLKKLRARLEKWKATYPTGQAKNEGYVSEGVLVPLHEFERHANQVFSL